MWNWSTVSEKLELPKLIGVLNTELLKLTNSIAEILRRQEGVADWTAGDTTPSVRGGKVFRTANTGATTVTEFDDGRRGQTIVVLFNDANTTLAHGANLKLVGSVNYTGSAGKVLQFVTYDGSVFYEVPLR